MPDDPTPVSKAHAYLRSATQPERIALMAKAGAMTPDQADRALAALGDDPVNPPHYRDGGVQCIDAMRRSMTREAFRGFCLGNAIKYAWRAGEKGPARVDYDKARWYLRRLIEDARA